MHSHSVQCAPAWVLCLWAGVSAVTIGVFHVLLHCPRSVAEQYELSNSKFQAAPVKDLACAQPACLLATSVAYIYSSILGIQQMAVRF
jgi:hypothetical protein